MGGGGEIALHGQSSKLSSFLSQKMYRRRLSYDDDGSKFDGKDEDEEENINNTTEKEEEEERRKATATTTTTTTTSSSHAFGGIAKLRHGVLLGVR